MNATDSCVIGIIAVMLPIICRRLVGFSAPSSPSARAGDAVPSSSRPSESSNQIVTCRPAFTLEKLSKSYFAGGEERRVLRDVSFEFSSGITIIVGASGEGKSTLLHILGGLDEPTSGVVCIREWPIDYSDTERIRLHRIRVGFIAQDQNLVSHLSVLENASLAMVASGIPRKEAIDRARMMLARVGLGDKCERRPSQLSGGERQRVALARVFASDAKVILADEPTSNLDPENRGRVVEIMSQLAKESQKPVIIVTHDVESFRPIANRVVRLVDGALKDEKREAASVRTKTQGREKRRLRGNTGGLVQGVTGKEDTRS